MIVNLKVKNIRPKYYNIEEWIDDNSLNEYIGRKGVVFINSKRFPSINSIWHNPYKINDNLTRDQVIDKYELYIRDKLESDSNLVKELLKLEGKNLGCWCKPSKCHGDIIIKLIEEYKNK